MKPLAWIRTFVLALALQNIAAVGTAGAEEIVGRLGTVELKTSEVGRILDAENPQAKLRLAASEENLNRFVRALLVRRAVLAEAVSAGWDKRPEIVEAINLAREQIIASAYLRDRAKAPADFPSDAAVKAFYEARPAQFTSPKQFHIAQIFVSAPDGADREKLAAARKRAEEIAAAARAGGDFAKLAATSSEDAQSAPRGGDIGWLPENQLAPDIRAAVAALSKNQVSAPVKLPPGWHVMKLLDSKPGSLRPLDEVRDAVVDALRAERTRENGAKYAEEIARKAPPEINEIELSRLWKTIH